MPQWAFAQFILHSQDQFNFGHNKFSYRPLTTTIKRNTV
jgi:hypothetical protein